MYPTSLAPDGIAFDRFRVFPHVRELLVGDTPIRLGGRAFDLLLALVEAPGAVLTKEELMARVWPDRVVTETNLQTQIFALRHAFGANRDMIRTVAGRGYQFTGEVRVVSPGPDQPAAARLPMGAVNAVATPTNLPQPASELIGRRAAVEHVATLVRGCCLVTLTGIGGIGKTRLALEVGRGLLPQFPDGTWLAELSALSDSSLVPATIAAAVGLELSGELSAQRVAQALASRRMLIVLDTCEHVIDAAAAIAEAILRTGSSVYVIATSREPLRADGERVYSVPPLAVPAEDADGLLDYGAVRLFLERARAADPDHAPDPREITTIATICRCLDGIPLAIEMAAARLGALGVKELARRLDDRFQLLTRGKRTALPRHQTLRATLDWSHDLLDAPERILLRHLAVFAGGFSLEAASTVAANAETTSHNVVDGIASLVAKSLVVAEVDGAIPRYHLLDTTCAYAIEKLSESGDAEQAARRHAEFYQDLFAFIAPDLRSRPSAEALSRHVREIGNVRAALDWSFSPSGNAAVGVVLTAAYAPVWQLFGLIGECRERTERALDRLSPDMNLSPFLRMQLHLEHAFALHITMAPIERTKTVSATALALAEELGDSHAVLRILYVLWAVYFVSGDCRTALLTAERFLDTAGRSGEPADRLVGERLMGNALQYAGRPRDAQRCLERVLASYVAPENQRHTILLQYDQRVLTRAMLARVLWLTGFADQAIDTAHATLDEVRASHELSLWAAVHHGVYPVAIETGNLALAEQASTMLSDLAARLDAPLWKTIGLLQKGKLLIRRGAFVTGLPLLRAALETCEETGWTIGRPEYLAAIGEGLAGLGQLTEGILAIEQALDVADRGGEHWYIAELLRLKGELLLSHGAPGATAAAEDLFRRALDRARQQGALAWELRAAMSFARLLRDQARSPDAVALLQPIHDRFTEGFDTTDLRTAQALLRVLHGSGVESERQPV
jgi:predicted ATPase/DNA-binding winged helix-turn-helix (wHTH) protein